MASIFRAGAQARIKGTDLTGSVSQVKYNEDTGEPRVTVIWTDHDGVEQHRAFDEVELVAVTDPTPAPSA